MKAEGFRESGLDGRAGPCLDSFRQKCEGGRFQRRWSEKVVLMEGLVLA